MSGGSYNYLYSKMEDAAEELVARHSSQPHVVALAALLKRVADVMHDIEWADSCDTVWDEKLDADIRALLAPDAETAVATQQAERALANLQSALQRRATT